MIDVKIITFDADDTLWHNEHYFQEAQQQFTQLMENFLPQHTVARELLHTEIKNIELYGYGIKAFILSMIETAIRISDGNIQANTIDKIIGYGQALLNKPVELMDGVEEVLKALKPHYRLVMATKGDLLDQERKLRKSGLADYFHHIEIMSEKKEPDFQKLIRHLDIQPHELVMIGNSLKSDVLPVLNLGGYGIHIPYHITWGHEHVEATISNSRFFQVERIADILPHFLK